MKYPGDGSPLIPTDDIPLVIDGSDQPAVDNEELNKLLPPSRRDGQGVMFQAVLSTARTALNFIWSRYGRKLNAQRTPRFADGIDLAAWGRHLKRPQLPDEGEGQYRDRLCTPLNTITPTALKTPVEQLVGELSNIKPVFMEPALDAAFASPLSFATGAPTWTAFAQPSNRRLWAQDDNRVGDKYGAYVVSDVQKPLFWFLIPDVGDDSFAPHSMDVAGARSTDQDYLNSAVPSWQAKAAMTAASLYGAAVALPDGRILFTGGQPSAAGAPVPVAAIYNPTTDTWTTVASMNQARARHALMMLDSGVVMAIGGTAAADGSTSLASVEIYDPVSNVWLTMPTPLNTARHSSMVVRLTDRSWMLIGGRTAGNVVATSGEKLNAATGVWSNIAVMTAARDNTAGAVVLRSNRVLVVGGAAGTASTTCELYNPATNTWASATAMSVARFNHGLAMLPSGRVLSCGGSDTILTPLSTAEVYDEGANAWAMIPSMPNARYSASVVLLKSGAVVVAGGVGPATGVVDQFDPTAFTWSVQPALLEKKSRAVAMLLPGDEPILFGGDNTVSYVSTVERLTPTFTAYSFTPMRPTSLMERIIGEIEPRRSAGYPWMLANEPLLGIDL